MNPTDTLLRTRDGDPPVVDALRRAMRGLVVAPSDPGWDEARAAWNLSADQRPELVAFPADATDVQLVVHHAAEHGLRVAPQSTGHAALTLDCDGAVLVRLSGMRGVSVDPEARIARAEGGAWWADVTAAAAAHGLVALAGSSPDVGIGGYCLGGGVSWLGRRHGLATNAVRAFELVTADGRLVRCDADHEPELFWALRGGGGNFGVVTAIEMQLLPITEVVAGVLFFPWERSREVLHAWSEWTRTVPDEVTSVGRILQFPALPEIPEPLRGGQFAVVEACMLLDEADAEVLLAPLRALAPAMDTFATIPASELAALHMDPPEPVPGISSTRLMDAFPPEAVDALVEAAGHTSGSVLLSVEVRHVGGALRASSPDHGALDRLDGDYLMFAVGSPFDADMAAAIAADCERVADATAPWEAGQGYVNFVEEPADVSHFFPAASFPRLQVVRRAWDPDGRFRANHPIPA